MKKKHLFLCLALLVPFYAFCQDDPRDPKLQNPSVVLSVNPLFNIPLGSDRNYYRLGGGLELGVAYPFLESPKLSVTAGLGYFLAPLQVDITMSMLPFDAGLRVDRELSQNLTGSAYIRGGYALGFLSKGGGSGGAGLASVGGDLALRLGPALSLGVGLAYRNFIGLYNDLSVSLVSFFHLTPGGRTLRMRQLDAAHAAAEQAGILELEEVLFAQVFPAFFKYYDEHPLGGAIVTNSSQAPVEQLKIQLYVKQYMDNPMPCQAPQRLAPGESGRVELYGLFTDQVLYMYEGTKVSVNISASYTLNGQPVTQEFIVKLRLYDRNSITWDDDRRAAAFVTSKDSTILRFAKNVAGLVTSRDCQALSDEMQLALALHEALRVYGLNYMVDPTTPYARLSQDKTAVDFIQFPRQTLEFKGGDCDDLSVLYCALLESLGIETAFITVPAHIYMAFALGMPAEEARDCYQYPEDLIFQEGKAWVPLEVTQRFSGFLDAWRTGAEEWRQYSAAGQARFYPVHTCWSEYEPVSFVETTGEISMPSLEAVAAAIEGELKRLIEQEVAPQAAAIREAIRTQGEQPRLLNSLGIVYARYGMYPEAEAQFNRALGQQDYVPALINKGNLCFLRDDARQALALYKQASGYRPENPQLLICMIKAHLKLGDREGGAACYTRLKEFDPELAEEFSHLGAQGAQTSRAAVSEGRILWQED